MTSLKVEIKGVPQLLAKLSPDLYNALSKVALENMGKAAAQQAMREAGSFRKTGALSSGITHKMNSNPKPLWVAVTTRKLPRRYAWILEFDAKYGHKNWLKNSVKRGQAMAGGLMSALASKIQAKWNS